MEISINPSIENQSLSISLSIYSIIWSLICHRRTQFIVPLTTRYQFKNFLFVPKEKIYLCNVYCRQSNKLDPCHNSIHIIQIYNPSPLSPSSTICMTVLRFNSWSNHKNFINRTLSITPLLIHLYNIFIQCENIIKFFQFSAFCLFENIFKSHELKVN